MSDPKAEKVVFVLEQDEDDYPPFAAESVWASPTDRPDELVIDNIPFFARVATIGDRVLVEREGGKLHYRATVAPSASSLIRVVFHEPREIERVRAELKALGCSTELFAGRKLIAVDVPGSTRLGPVQRYLAHEEERGTLGYEEPILRHPLDDGAPAS